MSVLVKNCLQDTVKEANVARVEEKNDTRPQLLSTCNWVRYHSHLSFFYPRDFPLFLRWLAILATTRRSIPPRRSLVCNRKTGKGTERKKIHLSLCRFREPRVDSTLIGNLSFFPLVPHSASPFFLIRQTQPLSSLPSPVNAAWRARWFETRV